MKKLITMSGVLIVGVVLNSCQIEANIRSNESKANFTFSGLTVLKNKQKDLKRTVYQ
ncbi:hypothetical protein HUE58_04440 [Candidatus Ruthia endofausta]|uniref:Uncharacterized protein n=1 Tax=Candidatus Ruthia endofausta TaxID=2738852 RepID=A0A6N0HPQ9_9GAMM|nr:hypothetical protein [Candidatus Ruthia endofausta]QKQ24379.1 hypothetical protein HUE58_04440 [Candidatus Ruthia endofausta]